MSSFKKTYDFSISTYCQAKCPSCPRQVPIYPKPFFRKIRNSNLQVIGSEEHNKTLPDGTESKYKIIDTRQYLNPKFSQKYMDLNIFKNILSRDKDEFKKTQIVFCGEFGDPMMHPQIEEFIDAVNNSSCDQLLIHTNGGIKKPDFYKNITKYKKLTIQFAIDGVTPISNNEYRVNVDTNLAFQNMITFTEHSYDRTSWHFLVFKHNYHEVPEVFKLAKTHNINAGRIKINQRDFSKLGPNDKILFERMIKKLKKPKGWKIDSL